MQAIVVANGPFKRPLSTGKKLTFLTQPEIPHDISANCMKHRVQKLFSTWHPWALRGARVRLTGMEKKKKKEKEKGHPHSQE